jgi:hypothetical protein
MTPDFLEIWDDIYWGIYRAYNTPLHSRAYYKVRSIVRVLVWVPVAYLTFAGALAVFG